MSTCRNLARYAWMNVPTSLLCVTRAGQRSGLQLLGCYGVSGGGGFGPLRGRDCTHHVEAESTRMHATANANVLRITFV